MLALHRTHDSLSLSLSLLSPLLSLSPLSRVESHDTETHELAQVAHVDALVLDRLVLLEAFALLPDDHDHRARRLREKRRFEHERRLAKSGESSRLDEMT